MARLVEAWLDLYSFEPIGSRRFLPPFSYVFPSKADERYMPNYAKATNQEVEALVDVCYNDGRYLEYTSVIVLVSPTITWTSNISQESH